jgi:hypothetical protein
MSDITNAVVFLACVTGAAWFVLAIIDRVRGT